MISFMSYLNYDASEVLYESESGIYLQTDWGEGCLFPYQQRTDAGGNGGEGAPEPLAARVHLSRSTLSKIEHGNYNRSISLDLLLDIADGLGIDLSMLFVLDRDEKDYWESVNGIELK